VLQHSYMCWKFEDGRACVRTLRSFSFCCGSAMGAGIASVTSRLSHPRHAPVIARRDDMVGDGGELDGGMSVRDGRAEE